jgi:hypothetical protein
MSNERGSQERGAQDERLAQLEREVRQLKAQLDPRAGAAPVAVPGRRFDPTANMTMPSTLAEMVRATDGVLADIVREQRTPSTDALPRGQTVSVGGAVPVAPGVSLDNASRGTPGDGRGWQDAKGIEAWAPPGLAIMEKMMDAEDAKWRAEREREFAKRGGR